ncbi:hypothetical protein B566_EDAN003959 [Ephemera danica]|nr:hypothetical protein B566_EDAN003959 [Ephemera danica]
MLHRLYIYTKSADIARTIQDDSVRCPDDSAALDSPPPPSSHTYQGCLCLLVTVVVYITAAENERERERERRGQQQTLAAASGGMNEFPLYIPYWSIWMLQFACAYTYAAASATGQGYFMWVWKQKTSKEEKRINCSMKAKQSSAIRQIMQSEIYVGILRNHGVREQGRFKLCTCKLIFSEVTVPRKFIYQVLMNAVDYAVNKILIMVNDNESHLYVICIGYGAGACESIVLPLKGAEPPTARLPTFPWLGQAYILCIIYLSATADPAHKNHLDGRIKLRILYSILFGGRYIVIEFHEINGGATNLTFISIIPPRGVTYDFTSLKFSHSNVSTHRDEYVQVEIISAAAEAAQKHPAH